MIMAVIEGTPAQVADLGGLQSALLRARFPVFGRDVYPGIHHKAAVMMESVNRNHPLVDGNKRMSWILTQATYLINGYHLGDVSTDTRYQLVIAVAVAEGHLHTTQVRDELERMFTSGTATGST